MHPSALLLIMVAVGTAAMVHGHLATAGTPAARFWQQALPGTPMPEVISDLVQKGIDQSPLVEHYSAALPSISICTLFTTTCTPRTLAETGIFFHEAQLRSGSAMALSFPAEAETPPFLPRDVANKVPFADLGDVLATFDIAPGSAEAAQVEDTLRRCREPPMSGEAKACTTSLESTVQAAMEMLGATITTTSQHQQGGDDDAVSVWAATPALPRGGLLPRRQYVVQAAAPLAGSRYVSCHKMPFPYAVYQCHATSMGYRAYMVTLSGGGPAAVSLLVFCHADTSSWSPAHPAFQVLGTRPGGSPVCHFMSYGNLAFVKKAASA